MILLGNFKQYHVARQHCVMWSSVCVGQGSVAIRGAMQEAGSEGAAESYNLTKRALYSALRS